MMNRPASHLKGHPKSGTVIDILLRNKGPELIEKSYRRTVKLADLIEVFPYVPINRSH
jgi:hypothetical protein